MGVCSEKWQKDLSVYKDINTTFIIEGNIHDKQPWFSELEDRHIPVSLMEYLNRYLENDTHDLPRVTNRSEKLSSVGF